MADSATEVVSLAEAKRELRLENSDNDALVTAHLESAVSFVSEYIESPLVNETAEVRADISYDKDRPITIRSKTVRTVTEIKYWSVGGNLNADPDTTLSSFGRVERIPDSARINIWPPDDGWPDQHEDATYMLVGLTLGRDTTKSIKQAVMVAISDLHDGMDLQDNQTIKALLAPYRRADP